MYYHINDNRSHFQAITTPSAKETTESCVLAYIGEAVDKKIFIRCPYAEVQLSYASPYVLVKGPAVINAIATPEPQSTYDMKLCVDKIVNICDVEKNYINDKALPVGFPLPQHVNKTVVANQTPPTQPPSSAVVTPSTTSSSSSSTTPNLVISNVVGGVSFSPQIQQKRPNTWAETVGPKVTHDLPRWDSLLKEIDRAAYSLVKGSGLEGSELYRCAVPNCKGYGSGPMHFNVHMMKHTTPEDQQNGYKCYHCPLLSKNIIGLKYHIKEHGIHRYFCYYCNHTAPIMNELLKHMEDTHNKVTLVTFPLNPKRTDQNKDMFVICPRGLRQEELNRFGMRLIERYNHTVTVNKKSFTPEEIDMIPMQAIMPNLISCANCAYSTKVRTNMIRHLSSCTKKQVDSNAAVQPHSDPVNPVPCLDTGELHFDKMRNLAGSSQNNGEDISVFVPEFSR